MIRQALLQDMLETMDVAPINNIEYVTLAALMLERAGYHATLKRFSGNTLQPEGLKERALRIASLAEDPSATGAFSDAPLSPVLMRELAAAQPSIRDARPPGWFRSHIDQRPTELDRNHSTLIAFRTLQLEVSTRRDSTSLTGFANIEMEPTTRFVYTPSTGPDADGQPVAPRAEYVVEYNPVAEVPMPAQPTEQQRSGMQALYEREIEHAIRVLAERERRTHADSNTSTAVVAGQHVQWRDPAAHDGDVF